MNHGSLGFFNENGQLSLKQEIIDGFCLGNNSKLYGIYYPCPPASINPLYANISLKHDFMLTPIPYRFWAVTAKLYINLLQHVPSLNKMCQYFEKRNISIIHAESTRSAYRYATWSLHIAFEDLLNSEDLTYEKELHCYRITQDKLATLLEDVRKEKELKDFLFRPDSFEVIEGTVNSPLACFTNIIENNLFSKDEKLLVKPFELTLGYDNKQKVFSGDSQYQFVISYLKAKNPDIFPAITFSELHQRALNIRSIIIPRKESKRFFRMGVEFERIGGQDTGVGIMHSITSKMENYNIWQSFNYTVNSSANYDKGNFVFLLENTTHFGKKNEDGRSKNSYLEEAEADFHKIIDGLDFKNITFNHLVIAPLPDPLAVKRTFELTNEERERKEYKYDVFISYSHLDEAFVKNVLVKIFTKHGLDPHVDRVFLNSETL